MDFDSALRVEVDGCDKCGLIWMVVNESGCGFMRVDVVGCG